ALLGVAARVPKAGARRKGDFLHVVLDASRTCGKRRRGGERPLEVDGADPVTAAEGHERHVEFSQPPTDRTAGAPPEGGPAGGGGAGGGGGGGGGPLPLPPPPVAAKTPHSFADAGLRAFSSRNTALSLAAAATPESLSTAGLWRCGGWESAEGGQYRLHVSS